MDVRVGLWRKLSVEELILLKGGVGEDSWEYLGLQGSPPRPMSMSLWCCPTILSSVVPFSSCPQSFPASGSFPISQLFTSDGQSIGASASASALFLPMNIEDWFPLRLTGLISLQSKVLSRVFSNTTVQKRQFFSAQPSSQSNSHIHNTGTSHNHWKNHSLD